MGRLYLLAAAALGGLAVAAGALATHGLRSQLSPTAIATFETAVRYQMYHALALLGVVSLLRWAQSESLAQVDPSAPASSDNPHSHRCLIVSGGAFILGSVLFCGSLYGLSLGVTLLSPVSLGLLTPLGGAILLCGWLSLGIAAWRWH